MASLTQANEVRVVFSEPMVVLGRIPDRVTASFFRITPAVSGTFRWSGTTVLVFTPDPKRPLPYATNYDITIASTATAVSGRRLAKPVSFRFTTPTARLLSTNWYRVGGTVQGPPVILLRFNQPVRPADVLTATRATLKPHAWSAPEFSPEEQQRLNSVDPRALERFAAKVRATAAVAASSAPLTLRLATDWDKKQFPPSPDLVALEVSTRVEPESWIELTLDPKLRAAIGNALPGVAQNFTIEAEKAFFINGFECRQECDADAWNPIRIRSEVKVSDFAAAITATDITAAARSVAKRATPRAPREYDRDAGAMLTLEDAGFDAQPPDRRYAVMANSNLRSVDGQTLGYTWLGIAGNWHMRAFNSFGDGHGVWEKDGGVLLPFYSRNIQRIMQWATPVPLRNLMPTLLELESKNFGLASGTGIERKLPVTPDRIQSHGLDLSKALQVGGTGLVWAAVGEGEPIPRARVITNWSGESRTRATLVQVTNLGISVKDSPQNTLVFVTRLDTGAPVAGAAVSIVRLDNQIHWRGTTDANGVAIAPDTPLRDRNDYWKLAFVVTAEKDGDVAYVGSDWNEGIQPWDFGTGADLTQAEPLLRGSVFTDRGVYRLGEEVHFKAILRRNSPSGVQLLPAGTALSITMRDSQHRVVDERTIKVSEWSSAEWTATLPQNGALGSYSLRAILESDRPKPRTPENRRPGAEPGPEDDEYVPWEKTVQSSFLVAAYRRPDFRVDVTLSGANRLAGDPLKGVVTGRYLFGAAMGPRPASWRFTASPSYTAPSAITERFTNDRWVFVGWSERRERSALDEIAKAEATLTKAGELTLTLDTKRDAGVPYIYTLEADVEDVSRQHLANRTTMLVHPAPWYIGVRQAPYFLQQRDGLKTEIVAAGLDGVARPSVPVTVTLTQIQWNSVRRAEGNGFYTWDTERQEVPAGEWKVTTASEPVPLQVTLPSGGYFILEAKAQTNDGRSAVTTTSFYALGDGYTAWARHDHNRIDLVPERRTYKPGDTARIMIQSPWEQATALLTTEREGIRTHRQFALTSTQQAVLVPIGENDIPNVFVSVLLIRGRTQAAVSGQAAAEAEGDASDPGKPAFRLGYVELKVEDASKRLTVNVTANREEYRPATNANVRVNVRDQQGRAARAEVALWAVDYGVLLLTNYRAPDVASSVYVRKGLQVFNADNRQRVVSRRVLTPKGATDGGGGGADSGAGTLRKDFRVLAFWVGSVLTDADGRADIDVKLPESLTTYRIMAVAADRSSRFGSGETDVRTNKPLTLKPSFPRFLAVGDTAHFGAVVTSQLTTPGIAVVTMKSLDTNVLQLSGQTEQRITVPAGGAVEVRFDAAGRAIGRARMQMSVKIGEESDSFEDVIPVEVLASRETVAAYGEATDANTIATETLTMPTGVVPGFGGLHVEVASTALVGLGAGAQYLVEYPYGCAEQKSSRTLALVLAADLGDAFTLSGMNTQSMRASAQQTLRELEQFQCANGGFAYWPGQCLSVSPYLTSYVLHVYKVAADGKYEVNAGVRERALSYLERELAKGPPTNEGWWPAYTAWKASAAKVLVESGRNQDSTLTRLYSYRDRMPVFALAYLHDALLAKGETSGERVNELRRRMSNSILTEAGSAHVEELNDPYLLWFWNSNIRSTAIVLNSLVAGGADAPFRPLVRWMMAARKNGRWGNTQENAHAMEALVAYYRKYESTVPNFSAIVRLGQEELARERFEGRSTESRSKDLPLATLLPATPSAIKRPLTFTREGAGTLFYTARLQYAVDALYQEGLNAGFRIERRYEPYVEDAATQSPEATTYKAGDLVRVTLTLRLTKERRFVAVTDPLPAGFEPVESWFATTARQLAADQDRQSTREDRTDVDDDSWTALWRSGGFDHVERHDDRVALFATRLADGVHVFSYVVRATTAGTFRTAPAHVEEMYEPEIFGRTATSIVEVKR
jgi:uncharacterized protein YfaS (alpha-2-macroglobulin family)